MITKFKTLAHNLQSIGVETKDLKNAFNTVKNTKSWNNLNQYIKDKSDSYMNRLEQEMQPNNLAVTFKK